MSNDIAMATISAPIVAADPNREHCHVRGYVMLAEAQAQQPGLEAMRTDTITIKNFPAPDGQVFDLHLMVITVVAPQEGQA